MELMITCITGILLFFAIYGLVLVIAGLTYKTKTGNKDTLPSIRLILPAFKPDEIFLRVLESVQRAKKNYPVDVLILFQESDQQIVDNSKKYGFEFVERSFSHLTGNSYRHALQYLCEHHINEHTHQYTLILDKDNIMDADFFDHLTRCSLNNHHIVQGARKPLDTTQGIQIFDAISERYNDLMLRKGKLRLGGVLEISGSAAVIDSKLFKYAINQMDEQAPGYDKNFMVKLLTGPVKLKSAFNDQMIVREEKTAEVDNYEAQRLRWFGEQYYNAFFNSRDLLKAAFLHGKFRSLDYWFTLIRPPRSLQLIACLLLVILDLSDLQLSYLSLPFLLSMTCCLIIALPIVKRKQIKQLLIGVHKVLYRNMITSAQSLRKKYRNTFIHTR
jgi:hypothetical protein